MGIGLSTLVKAGAFASTGYGILVASEDGSASSNDVEADVEHIYFQEDEVGDDNNVDDVASVSTESSCPAVVRPLPSGHVVKRNDDAASVVSSLFTRTTQKDAGSREVSLDEGVNELFIACQRGESGIVKLILGRGEVDINKATERKGETYSRRIGVENEWCDGMTPLYIACSAGHVQIVKQLFDIPNIDIHKAQANGVTPLGIACYDGHEQIVKQLLARPDISESVNKQDNGGQTPLFAACESGHEQIVHQLLARPNIDINKAQCHGFTPLYRACEHGHEQIVLQLLARPDINESVNKQDNGGQTPLFAACYNGHQQIVQQCLARPDISESVNMQNNNGRTPLYQACEEGHEQIVQQLLARTDISVNKKTSSGKTALQIASAKNHEDIVKMIREHQSKKKCVIQ